MGYLNAQQRENLLKELSKLNFNKAKDKVRRLDPNSRLVVYRNAQGTGRWITRYDLPALGTRVTLVEKNQNALHGEKFKSEFELVEVIVEALPGSTN
jgi:hypothetical protein